MEGANEPNRKPITLFTFNSHQDLSQFSKGCDADIGGTSTVNFTLEQPSPTETPFAQLWGEMRLGLRPDAQGLVRGGYAGFWSKVSPHLVAARLGKSASDRVLDPSVARACLETSRTISPTINISLYESAAAETLAREILIS